MNITIKPLTPELAADYFDFFENRAVMLNNRFGNKNKTTDCAIALIVTFKNTEDLRSCYEILRLDSTLIDPLNSASFTELGVQFLNRFGVQWAFMIEKDAL